MNIKELCRNYNDFKNLLNEEKIKRIYSIVDKIVSIIDEETFFKASSNSPEDLEIKIDLESKSIKLRDIETGIIYDNHELNDQFYSSLIDISSFIREICIILSDERFLILLDDKFEYKKNLLELGELKDVIKIDGDANEFFYIPVSAF